jgi:acyl-coenzyme A thioesterase PaaI-like protein
MPDIPDPTTGADPDTHRGGHEPTLAERIAGITDWQPRPVGETDPERLQAVTRRLRSGSLAMSPRRAELTRLADASRLLTARLVGTNAPDRVITDAAALLEEVAALFEPYDQDMAYGFSETSTIGATPDPMFDHSPVLGVANPVAPPMALTEEDGVVVATVSMAKAYEGPPGCVHGGFVAALFDEVLGAAQSLSGAPGMTGTLKVRYEAPTPLDTELRFEGRLVGVERRKIFTEGVCYAGDTVTARAEGIFISLNPGRFLELIAERERAQDEQRTAAPGPGSA